MRSVRLWAFLAVIVAVSAVVVYAVWPSSSESRPSRAAPGPTVATRSPSSESAINNNGNHATDITYGPYRAVDPSIRAGG